MNGVSPFSVRLPSYCVVPGRATEYRKHMDDHTRLRPEEFTVDRPSLRRVQSVGIETETPRSRLYGLAIEFAAEHRTDFKQFVTETTETDNE